MLTELKPLSPLGIFAIRSSVIQCLCSVSYREINRSYYTHYGVDSALFIPSVVITLLT